MNKQKYPIIVGILLYICSFLSLLAMFCFYAYSFEYGMDMYIMAIIGFITFLLGLISGTLAFVKKGFVVIIIAEVVLLGYAIACLVTPIFFVTAIYYGVPGLILDPIAIYLSFQSKQMNLLS